MSKFNTKSSVVEQLKSRPDATTNYHNALAFKPNTAELDLYLRACTGFVDDKFYIDNPQNLKDLKLAISKCSREFVLKLAHYVRTEMKLRSIPMILLGEAATSESFPGDTKRIDKSIVRKYTPKIIQRADEITEVLAYCIADTGVRGLKKNLPNALKAGIADSFSNFNEYQLAKYNRDGAVSLKDAVLLTHPKPKTPEQSALFKRILDDKLETPETWEVQISANGSTAATWDAIAPKMGMMALVRNLRNFEQKGAHQALQIAYSSLRDANHVQKSKLLPFRFLSASKEVTLQPTRDALIDALELSLQNLPKLDGDMCVFVDVSGSMSGARVSKHSNVTAADIATLMGAMSTYVSTGNYDIYAFATNVTKVDLTRRDSVLTNATKIRNTNCNGHGTNAYKCLEMLTRLKIKKDVILLFSDMQCYGPVYGQDSLAANWVKYRSQVNSDAILVSVDLQGYGSLQFPDTDKSVIQLAGWSEKIFDIINSYRSKDSIIELIKQNF